MFPLARAQVGKEYAPSEKATSRAGASRAFHCRGVREPSPHCSLASLTSMCRPSVAEMMVQDGKPLVSGSLLSRIFFLDAWPVLKHGFSLGSQLTSEDLPPLPASSIPTVLAVRMQAAWTRQLQKARPSLVLAIVEFYGREKLLIILVGPLAFVCGLLAIPLLNREVIVAIENDEALGRPLAFVAATFFTTLFVGIVQQHLWRQSALAGADAWLALTSLSKRRAV